MLFLPSGIRTLVHLCCSSARTMFYSGVRLIRRTNQPLPCPAAGSDFTHDAVGALQLVWSRQRHTVCPPSLPRAVLRRAAAVPRWRDSARVSARETLQHLLSG